MNKTSFLKKEDKSVSIKRQYTGTAGRVENAQISVPLAYSTALSTAFIDHELFLPEAWANDLKRRHEAHVPDGVSFRTKPQLALEMLKRAFRAGIKPEWVTADSVYTSSELRRYLKNRRQPFVLGVTAQFLLRFPEGASIRQAHADELSRELKPRAWKRVSAGSGTKGERVFARADVTLEKVVRVRAAGARWVIETGFEAAKNEAGLDEYEVRSWVGWYRHVTFSMLAHALLAVVRFGGRRV